MKKIALLICFALLLNSCATLLNGKNTRVNIYAPKNTKVQYKNQTSIVGEEDIRLYPKRSKDSLIFTLTNDSISADFAFKREISSVIYLNIPYTYGLGILVDLTNHKRFTHRRNIFFEIDSTTNKFKVFEGKIKPFKKHTTFIYTSPLMAIDVFTQPKLSLGTEYFFLDNASVSLEYATVYTERLGSNSKIEYYKNKGRSFRYELKYYNLISITRNPKVNEYIGLEARFMRYQYNKELKYYRSIEDINYFIREPIAVYKSIDIFNLKYGLNFPIGKHMYLDLYSGIGFRNKRYKNPNYQYNPETDQLHENDNHFFTYNNNNYLEGRDDRKQFNFSLGFKFGIKL